ncbi:MAG TPA: hypothetical protein VMT77_09970 [Gemmatimonadales bacterium]|nr:hypothetical protein [Gemmatimonadales bacterium]
MNPVHVAIERAGAYFATRETRQGFVARRLLGAARPEDERLAESLMKERRARIRTDGSVGGDLVATAWLAWELLDLGAPHAAPAVHRTVTWILGRQEKDGAFAEGCTPRRHELKLCEHAIGGFFSYRSSGRTVRRLTLPTGAAVTSDQGARFLASCFALRTVLRAGQEERTLVRRHVGSLLALPKMWDSWGGLWVPTLTVGALAAIAWAPHPFRGQLPILSEHLALNQKPDGSWRNLDIVHAVDALVAVPLPQAKEAVALAAPRLAKMQSLKGVVGSGPYAEERTLVSLRAWLIAREYA